MLSLSEYLSAPQLRVPCAPGFGLVYKLTPPASASGSNGYVGITQRSLFERLRHHKASATPGVRGCPVLSNALKAHGFSNFGVEIIEEHVPADRLFEAEMKWIAYYDTHANGYNCTAGGDANPMLDEDVRARQKAAKNTAESKAKTAAANRRAWSDPVKKKKRVAAINAVRESEAYKAHHKERSLAGHNTAAYKEKASKFQKLRFQTAKVQEEHRAMVTNAWAKRTPLERHSIIQKGWAKRTPEERRAISKKIWETRRANMKNKGA